jgi:16S rRNA (uracil1498-N3)-methyltransferase
MIQGDSVLLDGGNARRLLTVLRVKTGDTVILCDGQRHDYHGVVAETERNALRIHINEHRDCLTELPFKTTLFQGMPKSDKMEWIVQKTVELGVHSIVPVVTEHTESRSASVHKISRFRKIAEAAAAQSMRGIVPEVYEMMNFDEALEQTGAPGLLTLAAYENEPETTVRSILKDREPCDLHIWIGPEGGFSPGEITKLKNFGAFPVTLGPRILRTETAGIVVLSQTQCCWGSEMEFR